ncbi:hypothetical protein BJX64DRAFT_296234 [Aspergillus heterothallicus]
MAIGIAILGAGLFGKDEYLPAILSNEVFSLRAVYSRSQVSSLSFATAASLALENAYFTTPPNEAQSLESLLARPDIQAVMIALPIPAQPAMIHAALHAGKHVLSEKPIAKDVATAESLLTEYNRLYQGQGLIWSVAENFRFIPQILYGVEQLKRIGGNVTSFQISVHDLVKEGNPFYGTEWRKSPEYQGGFILDGGVHFLAGLRYFLAAVGDRIEKVVAFSTQIEAHLPPIDTLNGALLLKSGRSGTINFSYGTEFKSDFLIEVVTSKGGVSMTPAGVRIVESDGKGGKKEVVQSFGFVSGVKTEVEVFRKAVLGQTIGGDERMSAQEALIDLTVVERLLRSGEGGGVLDVCCMQF